MKIFNKYAYMGAIALVGAVGFTACSSDDDLTAPQNPTFDGESVKTQFAINIPYAGGKDTRMSEDATQGDGASASFNGMQSIYLLPLTATGSGASTFNSIIPLPAFTGFDDGSSNYKLYNDVNVPVGTTHFLFYGIGKPTDEHGNKFVDGSLESTLPKTASAGEVKFNLEKILTGNEFTTPQTKLLEVLNQVSIVQDWSTQSVGTELGDLYASYKTLTGGSANSIKLTMEELYNAVNGLATATSDSPEKTIALAIQDKIDNYFTVGGSSAPYTLTWNISEPSDIANYPTNLNVPEGAAQVTWDNTSSEFKYVNNNAIVGTPDEIPETPDKVVNVYNLCYPASLAYFVNTPLKATTEKNVTWPNTASNWESEQWDGWTDAVAASTQTVALKDNIQYGVANLNTTVTCKTSTLEDNASAVVPGKYSANQQIVVPADGFQVTGLLVGGQPDFASWNMTPAAAADFTMTVYDNSLTDIYAKYNAVSNKNYTLLLDNTVESNHKPVNIALELVNNSGTDFYGVGGKIAKGAKFYLVAQLNPTAGTGVTQPSGTTLNDVFVQDYVTTANLTITSLKNAYVTIPDLRASELVLGLSVDLTWDTGLKFDVDIE